MTTPSFDEARQRKFPVRDVPDSDIAALLNEEPGLLDKVKSSEYTPIAVYYEGFEELYWLYGNKVLYEQVFQSEANPTSPEITWNELHCFVRNYAWIERRWRFLFDKPCWHLHPDVTDRLVDLLLGVRWHEKHRNDLSPAQMVSYREMVKYLAQEAKQSLADCQLKEAKYTNTGRSYTYVEHHAELSTRSWIESLLRRVFELDGALLPPSPVMNTSFALRGSEGDEEDGDS